MFGSGAEPPLSPRAKEGAGAGAGAARCARRRWRWRASAAQDVELDVGASAQQQQQRHARMVEEMLEGALHAFADCGFCMADRHMADMPLVWMSEGIVRMSGYGRRHLIGRNCRKLQCDATDPSSVAALGEAVGASRGVRVTLYNRTRLGQGFWNCLTLHPSVDDTGGLRYYVSVQVALTPEMHKRVVRLQRLTTAQAASTSRMLSPLSSPQMLRPMPQLSTPSSVGASSSDATSRQPEPR